MREMVVHSEYFRRLKRTVQMKNVHVERTVALQWV